MLYYIKLIWLQHLNAKAYAQLKAHYNLKNLAIYGKANTTLYRHKYGISIDATY